jgi:sugar lactone lactonase YvrE
MTADLTVMQAGAPEAIEEDPGKRRRRKALVLLLLFLGLLLLLGIAIWYLLFRQPINPIPPIPVSQIPTYSTSMYGVTRPIGVAVSSSGERIYVTEGGATGTGVVLDGAGNVVGKMIPPASAETDRQPVYAAVDPRTSEVYVSDRLSGTIYIYDEDGAFQRELVLPEPRPGWQPMGMTFDADGNLYVTDFSGPFQKVLVIDRDLRVVRTLGEGLNLNFPNGIAVAKDGTIYVTDSNNGRLVTFDADGKGTVRIGRGAGQGNLGLPRGLAIDESDRIFTVDTTAQGVLIYRTPSADDQQVGYLGSFGVQGIADGQFGFPSGIALDSRGRVYVADTFNNRVQIWSY